MPGLVSQLRHDLRLNARRRCVCCVLLELWVRQWVTSLMILLTRKAAVHLPTKLGVRQGESCESAASAFWKAESSLRCVLLHLLILSNCLMRAGVLSQDCVLLVSTEHAACMCLSRQCSRDPGFLPRTMQSITMNGCVTCETGVLPLDGAPLNGRCAPCAMSTCLIGSSVDTETM